MDLNPLISIILPCYNVEKYIANCLDSIYSQGVSLELFEVICVNDCSPDRSVDIIKEYQCRYSNLRLVNHSVNKCLGGARNSGMDSASGDYIWFVDSDDTIVGNTLCTFQDLLKHERGIDILLFNYNRVNCDIELVSSEFVFKDSEVLSGVSFLRNGFGGEFSHHLGYVWRMLFRREYLTNNNLRFPENIFWEDTVFFPKSILLASKVKSISDLCYNYRINPESISSRYDATIPAQLIYQHSFLTGLELLNFANEAHKVDVSISKELKNRAILHYINGFIIKLLRTSNSEKRVFYSIIKHNQNILSSVLSYMNNLNKLICNKYIGYYILCLLTFAYNIKHK